MAKRGNNQDGGSNEKIDYQAHTRTVAKRQIQTNKAIDAASKGNRMDVDRSATDQYQHMNNPFSNRKKDAMQVDYEKKYGTPGEP